VAQAQQGKFREAVGSYGEALKRDPANEAARRNLEAARSRAGR
jgi:cytochrome c-type biogenesis protein CcmH/NrfG